MTAVECRPRFVLWTALLRQLPLQLFLTIWAGIFFGGFFAMFGMVAAAALGRGSGGSLWALLLSGPAAVSVVFFVGVPVLTVGAKWLNYRNTRYRIDERYLTIEEGFWTVQTKRLLVADIREVTLRRGPLQRMSGVGSIYLASRVQGGGWAWRGTPLTGATSLVGSGAMLMDLPDWAAVFAELQRRLPLAGEGEAG